MRNQPTQAKPLTACEVKPGAPNRASLAFVLSTKLRSEQQPASRCCYAVHKARQPPDCMPTKQPPTTQAKARVLGHRSRDLAEKARTSLTAQLFSAAHAAGAHAASPHAKLLSGHPNPASKQGGGQSTGTGKAGKGQRGAAPLPSKRRRCTVTPGSQVGVPPLKSPRWTPFWKGDGRGVLLTSWWY